MIVSETNIPDSEILITVLSEAEFYITLYDKITKNGPDNVDHGIRGYYYGENGESSSYDLAKEIGRVLVELGLNKSDEPVPWTREELVKYFGSEVCIVC